MMIGKTLPVSNEAPFFVKSSTWKPRLVNTPVPIMFDTTSAAAGQVETACLAEAEVAFTFNSHEHAAPSPARSIPILVLGTVAFKGSRHRPSRQCLPSVVASHAVRRAKRVSKAQIAG